VELSEQTNENEMVAEFLRSDLLSQRFSEPLRKELTELGLSEELLLEPDVSDDTQNEERQLLLGRHRGWKTGEYLFADFPEKITWYHAVVTPGDLPNLLYMWDADWVVLSEGTCRLTLGARRVSTGKVPPGFDAGRIEALRERIADGEDLGPPIMVGTRSGSRIVILKGASRATAHAVQGFPERLEVIYGLSDMRSLINWRFFPKERTLA
jgi:hypothetical protein